ncbi:MAG: hypothetical protein J7L73_02790, partial [Anaerolineales bacterium]|nr:hypothetical protein [Anaerolineales bacterium]
IGSGRLLASVAEEHHDEHGLIWPITVAPYQVHLIILPGKDKKEVQETAERLYQNIKEAGIEVLFDDRNESPGVKFNDADLIGNPLRVTVSQRSLNKNCVEFKRRDQKEKTMIPLEAIIPYLKKSITELEMEIKEKEVEVPFTD